MALEFGRVLAERSERDVVGAGDVSGLELRRGPDVEQLEVSAVRQQ
jgi:hypothetical protein